MGIKINGMTLAQVLRDAEQKGLYQAGHRRTLRGFYMSESKHHNDYFRWSSNINITNTEYAALKKLHDRWRRFINYCSEIAPQWKTVDYTYWTDNSVDAHQVDKHGNTRTIMTTAPNGDACY